MKLSSLFLLGTQFIYFVCRVLTSFNYPDLLSLESQRYAGENQWESDSSVIEHIIYDVTTSLTIKLHDQVFRLAEISSSAGAPPSLPHTSPSLPATSRLSRQNEARDNKRPHIVQTMKLGGYTFADLWTQPGESQLTRKAYMGNKTHNIIFYYIFIDTTLACHVTTTAGSVSLRLEFIFIFHERKVAGSHRKSAKHPDIPSALIFYFGKR